MRVIAKFWHAPHARFFGAAAGAAGEVSSSGGLQAVAKPSEGGKILHEEFYNETALQTVNEISHDFQVLWSKHANLLKKAGVDHSGVFLAEELLHHISDRLWLERRETQGLIKKRCAKCRKSRAENTDS